MARTNCKVNMEFVDTSAILDSNILTDDNAGIGNVELLRENAEYSTYAIPDLNSFLMDGSRSILQDDAQIPFISSEASTDECAFNRSTLIGDGDNLTKLTVGVDVQVGDVIKYTVSTDGGVQTIYHTTGGSSRGEFAPSDKPFSNELIVKDTFASIHYTAGISVCIMRRYNPAINIKFTQNHTSAGITLYFVEDYPAEIKITWYGLNGVVLFSDSYYPDKLRYYCMKQVENYGGLKIELIRTRLPGQRVKLGYIKYGTAIEWAGTDIKSASLSEEVDVTSATIPINTADISIVDTANDFSLSNQNGAWKSFQKKQPLTITETVDGKDIVCGTLYLDKWKSQSNVVSFSLIDLVGIMGKTKFYDGQIYVNVAAGVIIDSIMKSAGVEDYTISGEVAEILLTGHIAICTHREALQQVLFACGAIADCSRTGGLNIYMPDRFADKTVGTDRRFMGTTIEVDDYVSGVAITYNQYKLSEEAREIFKDALPAGLTRVEFSEPCTTLRITGGTLLEAHANYALVRMDAAGECAITGYPYEKNVLTYTANVEKLEAGEEPNILSYEGCTMFNAERVKDIAERILNYYQLRQLVIMRYLVESERTGEWISIRGSKGGMIATGIISQIIDLTGGFVASAKCRGYSKVVTDQYYAGEFYAGERGLI